MITKLKHRLVIAQSINSFQHKNTRIKRGKGGGEGNKPTRNKKKKKRQKEKSEYERPN